PDELDTAFSAMARARGDALIVLADPIFFLHRERLADLAAKNRLPAIYGLTEHAEAGGLMAYSANFAAVARRAATHVDRILKGARPGDLPVEQPTRFELIINLKTAKALDLTIPSSLLLRADQLIE
ncbi:MAG TPA: ABC transporter substrate-binding protein, partial [Methylomirabilota bacterium]|nr:ABC transporter substrate-binding protein [Methylomirabilota bacterium]